MSLRLKTRSGGPPVGATLVTALAVTLSVILAALMLALFPAAAEAQTMAQTDDENIPSVMVRPGDSLWSISERRLGPNATPIRIANAAERIHSLNRAQIGADPNMIFVGQELLVPPAMTDHRPTGTMPVRKATGMAEDGPRARAAKGTGSSKAPKPVPRSAPGGADVKGGESFAPVVVQREAQREAQRETEPISLPVLPDAATDAPAARTLVSNDVQAPPVDWFLRTIRTEGASAVSKVAEASFGVLGGARVEGRQQLGLGIVLLTLVAAAFMAWKLPMRRTIRRDAQRWGTLGGYFGYGYPHGSPAAALRVVPFAYHPASLGEGGDCLGAKRMRSKAEEYILRPESGEQTSPGNHVTTNGHAATNGHASVASTIRKAATGSQRRTPKAKKARGAVPRNGLALGAHNPKVRRATRRAHAPMRARRLRPPRRGSSRRLGSPPLAIGQAMRQREEVGTHVGR